MLPYDEMDFRFVDKKKHPDFYWACSDYPQCDTYVGADSKGRPAARWPDRDFVRIAASFMSGRTSWLKR